jgi:beta-galactosidase/beta-glucuronidase
MNGSTTTRATQQDGTYPRPLLVRADWTSLDGEWSFAADDDDTGLALGWWRPGAQAFDRTILVPFPPESVASGIGDHGRHPVVWYRRTISADRASGLRTLVHFGAVDQEAQVWVDGRSVGGHRGGQTAFSVDVTDALDDGDEHELVVRAFDDPDDPAVPRGKQDWLPEPHAIWYRRSTGIWRSVWLERVPPQRVDRLDWTSDPTRGTVTARIALAQPAEQGLAVRVRIASDDEPLAGVTVDAVGREVLVTLELPALRNAQERERLLWSPEHPVLLDARVEVLAGERTVDLVDSYVGVRSVGVGRGAFLLNGRPYFVRSVLEQGYWPDSQFTPPSVGALREEVEHILALGFTAARIHQKVEDPRFLFWADRLGLLIWAETAAAYGFSPRAAARLTAEWTEIVEQQRNHPSVVTWVPVNESWGVQDIATEPAQQQLAQALASLTRALDPTRPVISNDGWEHVDSDILSVHDYTTDGAALRANWADETAVAAARRGFGPAGRAIDAAGPGTPPDAPLMITEFGGIAYAAAGTWGYAVVTSDEAFDGTVAALFDALRASPLLAGFCYTQLTDTMQESNGLLTADRRPKLPIARLRAIVTGSET